MKDKKASFYKEILKDKSWITVSNILTVSRILLTPIIVFGIFKESWNIVFGLIFFVGISDLLDGYLARLLDEGTNLGKILDPLADKFLIISLFSSLAFRSPSFSIPIWFVILILLRELIIIFGTGIILHLGINVKISPTIWGKLTTFFQLLFIFWLFVCNFFKWMPARTYYILLILLSIFSIFSLFKYIKLGINYLLGRFLS